MMSHGYSKFTIIPRCLDYLISQAVRIQRAILCDTNAAIARPGHKSKPHTMHKKHNHLPIALGDTLQLILLLDGVRVAASLCSIDQFFSQALSDRLDVSEGGFTGTNCEESDGLVDTAERGDIDGLTTDSTSRSDTGGIFARSTVNDGVNCDLDRVLVGHDVNLEIISAYISNRVFFDIQSQKSGRQF